ncbi:chemosensory receptor c [Plakobranchus ocellatus]|uniref:Chemosensory receptor c n=1 Tax=Plakobranchus ocellatus TaxID=259542 RepID=A0AAV4C0P2_9GAST|nr:chemosensory receptor c [Plakobranchus ocellatus]
MMDNTGVTTATDAHITVTSSGLVTPFYADFLDERRRRIAKIVLEYVIVFGIAILGIVTNILVILVYSRQGFKEGVAISMTTIAVWDLIKALCGVFECFTGILSLFDPAAAFSWSNVSIVVFNYLLCFSSYVTSVMAAYVAVERCLCVCMPLKVKWLLTPRVTLTACLVISVVVFCCFAVMFGIYDIRWEWSAEFNATVAVYRKNQFYIDNEEPLFQYYNLSGILWPFVSFVVILIATIIITFKLRQSSKFRARQSSFVSRSHSIQMRTFSKNNSKSEQQDQERGNQQPKQQLSSRDQQVVKMLLVIIIIYIVCLSPRIALYIGKYIVHDFYFLRRYHHLFGFVIYWLWIADFSNGAVNFFVFYSMSSSFRSTCREMFSSHNDPS